MNSALFDTDFKKLGTEHIRVKHRDSNQRPLMDALMTPMEWLDGYFARFRESEFYSLQHNYTKSSIEKVLNDAFDNTARRIYIDNVEPQVQLYLYEPGDDRPVYLYEPADDQPVYLRELSAADLGAINFVVYLPNPIRSTTTAARTRQDTLINAAVNKFKDHSKNHTLLWIS